MTYERSLALILVGSLLHLGGGCGPNGSGPDGSGGLSGKITDATGRGVIGAEVSVFDQVATSDIDGNYALSEVPAGTARVGVRADWYADKEVDAEVVADQDTTLNLDLIGAALKIEASDRALAETFNAGFDWSVDRISIAAVAEPSRALIEHAIYHRNPALYEDTSGDSVVPDPLPDLGGGFDFPVEGSPGDPPAQALDPGSLRDDLDGTGVTADDALMWEPAVEGFLLDWDLTKAEGLFYVGFAVEGQRWGGSNTFPAQHIEQLFLHQGELWVEVVFEDWLELGAGVTDSDGDGYREIFGKVAASHFTQEVYDQLANAYVAPRYTTLELKDLIAQILDDLYSRTNPQILRSVGQPYTVDDVGDFLYPFVVLEHSNGAVNVLLVDG